MPENEISRWTGYGAGLLGSLTGAAVGTAATGEPAIAVVGAFVGQALESALAEAGHQLMSRRQKARVGVMVTLARDRLIALTGAGSVLRGDEFMRARIDGRSPADEVIEHVIQVSQNTFEERKLPHVAAVLAHIAVSSDIDEATAHWAVSTIETLSWHKLVALAAIATLPPRTLPSIDPEYLTVTPASWPLRRAIYELFNRDSLLTHAERAEEGTFNFGTPPLGKMKLSPAGELLVRLADLRSIAHVEVVGFSETLRDSAV